MSSDSVVQRLYAKLRTARTLAEILDALDCIWYWNKHEVERLSHGEAPSIETIIKYMWKIQNSDLNSEADRRLTALCGKKAQWILFDREDPFLGASLGLVIDENGKVLLHLLTIEEVHAAWVETDLSHPFAPLFEAVMEIWLQSPSRVPVITLRHNGEDHLRSPGLVAAAMLSPLETVMMDGEPFGSAAPVQMLRRARPLPPPPKNYRQLELFPYPRTLAGAAVDPVLSMLSGIDWQEWDGRSPIRSDVMILVRLGCAIGMPTKLSLDDWARVLRSKDGRVQQAARTRAQDAITLGAMIVWHKGQAFQMVRATTEDGEVAILPSAGGGWWNGGKGKSDTWRLSGGLWRRHWTGSKQGGHRRMAEGIEAALAWTPPNGKGMRGRISRALRPEGDRPGNPGAEYFIDWRRVLHLSGEPYPAADDLSANRLYQKRVAAFKAAGYVTKGRKPAAAGDTWEITRIVRGGLYVRASARYVEAVHRSQRPRSFTWVSLDLLLQPPLAHTEAA